MSKKTFLTLLVLAIVTGGAATWTVLRQPDIEAADVAGDLFFPDLIQELNAVKSIAIEGENGTFTLVREDDDWVMAERGNYPVKPDKIVELLINTAQLSKLEPKTSDPDKYERLDLDEPGTEGSDATGVTITLADGTEVADFITGRRKFMIGDTEGGIYVRLPDDPQTWLAKGALSPGNKARDWLVRDVIDIDRATIAEVTLTQPDGEKLSVVKTEPGMENFIVEGLVPGKELRRDTVANELASVPDGLLLDDVSPADELAIENPEITTGVYKTFDGLSLTIRLQIDGDWHWITVSASAGEDASEDVQDRVAEINARTNGWAFQVPAFEVNQMKKTMADMVKEPAS